jgi:hypothetical protein
MSKKRGKLSNPEMDYIEVKHNSESIEDIAIRLNRTPETIQRYLENKGLVSNADSPDIYAKNLLKNKLAARTYYKEAQKQFSPDEMRYFEENWVELFLQFKEDVLFSEEIVIKDWLTLDILMGRALKERKKCETLIEEVETEYMKEFVKGDGIRDNDLLSQLEVRKGNLETSLTNYTKDHTNLLKEVKHMVESLKANRNERIKRIEDSKTSWIGFLRAMQDPTFRMSIAEEIELVRISKDISQRDLSKQHMYADGKIDHPFLTPELVESLEEDEPDER